MTTDLTVLWHTNRRWRAWMDANTRFVTPDTLDCLRYLSGECHEVRDLWMRQEKPGHARNNERNSTIGQELADVVMLALTVLDKPPVKDEWFIYEDSFDVDQMCDAANMAVMVYRWESNWRPDVFNVLGHVLAYPGLDLAAELDRCWRRLAMKHGQEAYEDALGLVSHADRLQFHAQFIKDPTKVPAPWLVEESA